MQNNVSVSIVSVDPDTVDVYRDLYTLSLEIKYLSTKEEATHTF